MRRFEVWMDRNIAGVDPTVQIVEMPESATSVECEEACQDALDTMISNDLDTGWREIDEDGNEVRRAK